jgi:hypothetical protein
MLWMGDVTAEDLQRAADRLATLTLDLEELGHLMAANGVTHPTAANTMELSRQLTLVVAFSARDARILILQLKRLA